jgi:hypothetical protein
VGLAGNHVWGSPVLFRHAAATVAEAKVTPLAVMGRANLGKGLVTKCMEAAGTGENAWVSRGPSMLAAAAIEIALGSDARLTSQAERGSPALRLRRAGDRRQGSAGCAQRHRDI